MSQRNVLVRLLSSIWRALNSVRKVLHLLLLLIIFGAFFGALSGTAPILPQKAALVIQPGTVLVEQQQGDPFDRAVGELFGEVPAETVVQDVIDALDFAKSDDRIAAVHFELSGLGSAGLSKLQRVSAAIDAFRESGKPVIASADIYTQASYYLAAHADELYLHPEGLVYLQGYGTYRNYFKDAIDLLRIDWNIFRVGTHKSFVEPYTRMDMSPEDRESRGRLIGQFWGAYKEEVAAARELPEGAVGDFVQNMVSRIENSDDDIAEAARDNGLVDDLLGRAALREVLKSYAGEDEDDESQPASVFMRDYLGQMRLLHGPKPKSENIAIVVAAGTILGGTQPPGTVGGDSTAALLREALTDESVKAVVLRVDSPGGSQFASEVIVEEIKMLQEAGKPVVASMSSVAASGGYWISVVADKVIASPSTVTGSIGVFAMIPTFQRTLRAVGVATDGVTTTPWAGALRPDVEMSVPARQLVQTLVENIYDEFVSNVAEHRGMDKQAVDRIAQGQVWTGVDAMQNGLVDQLGNLDEAIVVAAELAGVADSDYGTIEIESKLSPTEQMILDFLSAVKGVGLDPASFVSKPAPIESFANRLQKLLVGVTQFNDPKGIYSHCLCEID